MSCPPRLSAVGTGNEVTTLGQVAFYSQYDWLGRRFFFNMSKDFLASQEELALICVRKRVGFRRRVRFRSAPNYFDASGETRVSLDCHGLACRTPSTSRESRSRSIPRSFSIPPIGNIPRLGWACPYSSIACCRFSRSPGDAGLISSIGFNRLRITSAPADQGSKNSAPTLRDQVFLRTQRCRNIVDTPQGRRGALAKA